MEQQELPRWEPGLVEEAISAAEEKLAAERSRAAGRAVQLAREQAYHRLAVAIDRPAPEPPPPGQLRLFDSEDTLFDESA